MHAADASFLAGHLLLACVMSPWWTLCLVVGAHFSCWFDACGKCIYFMVTFRLLISVTLGLVVGIHLQMWIDRLVILARPVFHTT